VVSGGDMLINFKIDVMAMFMYLVW